MSANSKEFKTPNRAKKLISPTSTLERRISESSTNNNKEPPPVPIKRQPSPTTRSGDSRVRRRLFPINETAFEVSGSVAKTSVTDVAEMANREILPPPDVTDLFARVDSHRNKLDPNSKIKLIRAHSAANSVMSLKDTDPDKITTLYDVKNVINGLQSEIDKKLQMSVNQLREISTLEKKLKREQEKHARATALIKELMMEDQVPITKIVRNNNIRIDNLTRQMEKLKNVSNAERSKLLGLIASISIKQKAAMDALSAMKKKEQAAMGAVSKVKNVAVSIKKKAASDLDNKVKEYAKKVEEYEKLIKKISNHRTLPRTTDRRERPQTQTQTVIKTITPGDVKTILKGMTNAKTPAIPPGITKTNVERLLMPFKQPITVTVAPTISVKAGSAKATATGGSVMQLISKNMILKKPNNKKKPLFIDPYQVHAKTMRANKYRELVKMFRTPTRGQRKTHVISLIDRVLKSMKVPADIEKKLIYMYDKSMTEKQIKALFAGRSREDIRSILKKQVEYLKKKR